MKIVAMSGVLVAGIMLSGLSSASDIDGLIDQEMVDYTTMDRIVGDSSGEFRLAHHRGRYDGRRKGRRHSRRNKWVGPAVAGVILGAIIASQSSSSKHHYRDYDSRDYRAAKRRCDRKYRSYDWDTDTFVTYGCRVKLCPYVRPYY